MIGRHDVNNGYTDAHLGPIIKITTRQAYNFYSYNKC